MWTVGEEDASGKNQIEKRKEVEVEVAFFYFINWINYVRFLWENKIFRWFFFSFSSFSTVYIWFSYVVDIHTTNQYFLSSIMNSRKAKELNDNYNDGFYTQVCTTTTTKKQSCEWSKMNHIKKKRVMNLWLTIKFIWENRYIRGVRGHFGQTASSSLALDSMQPAHI